MGVNNKARRAARRRRQRGAAQRRDFARERSTSGRSGEESNGWRPADADSLAHRLALATQAAIRANWTPNDLAQITRRRLSARHAALVAALVADETNRHPLSTITHEWRDELRAMGQPESLQYVDEAEIEIAHEVAVLLMTLPTLAAVIPPPGALPQRGGGRSSGAPSAVLAKVRALLAKAESTEFPAEAEALSAKAQKLIATYALDRHAAQLDEPAPEWDVTVCRLWIDPPYVGAKAMLVDAVAGANHCRAVLSRDLGFVTLIGQRADVEATELLVTSLQVQADRAMLRHGQVGGGVAGSRTRSFRRSFLVSYASRIRERLRHTTEETLAAASRSRELVPVVARNDERVRAATEKLFPELTMRRTTISDPQGWVAGRAAADLADFGVRRQVSDQAAS